MLRERNNRMDDKAIVKKYWVNGEFQIGIIINDSLYKLVTDAIELHRLIVELMDIGYKIEFI